MIEIFLIIALLIDAIYLVVLVSSSIPFEKQKIRKLQPVSVIIASKDGTVIEKTLRALKRVKKPALEIIVVSADQKTLGIAKKYGAKTVKDRGVGKGAALNLAVRHATHDILYFVDEDMIVRQDTIEKVCSALNTCEVSTGYNRPHNAAGVTSYVARLYVSLLWKIQYSIYRMIGTTLASGRNTAMYKKTLKEAGGFTNALTEDMGLSFRLLEMRKKIKFVNAVAADQVPEKFSSYLRQQQRWTTGTGDVINGWKKSLARNDVVLVGFILLLGMMAPISLAFLLLALASKSLLLLSVPAVAFLLCLSAVASLGRRDVVLLPVTFFAFIFIHTLTVAYSAVRKPKGWYITPKT